MPLQKRASVIDYLRQISPIVGSSYWNTYVSSQNSSDPPSETEKKETFRFISFGGKSYIFKLYSDEQVIKLKFPYLVLECNCNPEWHRWYLTYTTLLPFGGDKTDCIYYGRQYLTINNQSIPSFSLLGKIRQTIYHTVIPYYYGLLVKSSKRFTLSLITSSRHIRC